MIKLGHLKEEAQSSDAAFHFHQSQKFLPAVIINSNNIQLLYRFDLSVETDTDIKKMLFPFHVCLNYSISLVFQVSRKVLRNKRKIRRAGNVEREAGKK